MENPYVRMMAALAWRQELLEEAERGRIAAAVRPAASWHSAPREALAVALIALAGRLAPELTVGNRQPAVGFSSQS